ncbi:uncharacterized protein LOC121235715 isoform X3 [Juglans microcarpa x Juglans regia]|uniref:uncharacterized protein LOC121235715 isoform X3 n=1 Tax=Juglans microcarpa x Juglans regia TaxID=2249226 RepID=UPI001B7F6AE6|nr:uncharacterized protein LOC121235715 isoform X3 [Juglans microcarpa x Juglans regia]
MLSLRGSSRSSAIFKPLLAFQRKPLLISTRKLSRSSPRRNLCFSLKPSDRNGLASASSTSETYVLDDTPMSGMEDVLVSYIYGKKRATEVAHLVWKHVVKKGDTVIDATCGNGYDTLALLKMVSDELGRGCVYAMDIQKDAIVNTNSLLEESVNANERDLVKLLPICHSELDKVVPEKASVRYSLQLDTCFEAEDLYVTSKLFELTKYVYTYIYFSTYQTQYTPTLSNCVYRTSMNRII